MWNGLNKLGGVGKWVEHTKVVWVGLSDEATMAHTAVCEEESNSLVFLE